ncbi:dephospho-CoA kinase [Peniophora sp. CONT]|nr:dephospho-CoA kinase [Peniophora sp. CONT]
MPRHPTRIVEVVSNHHARAMLVVGLTGGISTGKSTVSNLLKQRGVLVIDADILAREVVVPGTSGLRPIVSEFGADVLQEDGSLDRPKLGSIIFNDEGKRKKLDAIVHPAVGKAMVWAVLKHWLKGDRACVLDVPLLIESGIWSWAGKVVVVYWYILPTS